MRLTFGTTPSPRLTDADLAALDGATSSALSALSAHLALVKLVADTGKLDLAPGACDTLRRVDTWLAEHESQVGLGDMGDKFHAGDTDVLVQMTPAV